MSRVLGGHNILGQENGSPSLHKIRVPSPAPMWDGLQSTITSAPGDQMAYSGLTDVHAQFKGIKNIKVQY